MRRFPWFIVAGLALLVVISSVWGFRQMQVKDQLLTRLENTYQRAFHELAFHMAAIENELVKTTVASTPRQAVIRMSAVWRQAYAAQEKIGQIPLGVVELQNTEQYLARLGDFMFSMSARGAMPNGNEMDTLRQLSGQARELSNQIIALQATVLGNNLRWTTLEIQTLQDKAPRDSGILNFVHDFEQQIQEFPEVSFGEHVNVAFPAPLALAGEEITLEQAVAIAQDFTRHIGKELSLESHEDVVDALVPHFSLIFRSEDDRRVVVEVVKGGGRVFQVFADRSIGAPLMAMTEVKQKATEFLEQRGITGMQMLGTEEWGNSVVFTYCHTEDGLLFYPDLLRVRVAQDNGEVVSFEGNGYTMYHRPRTSFGAEMGLASARAMLNGNLVEDGMQRVVIFNGQGNEILCYEFLVSLGEEQFLVYINAVTGDEENIVRLLAKPLPMAG